MLSSQRSSSLPPPAGPSLLMTFSPLNARHSRRPSVCLATPHSLPELMCSCIAQWASPTIFTIFLPKPFQIGHRSPFTLAQGPSDMCPSTTWARPGISSSSKEFSFLPVQKGVQKPRPGCAQATAPPPGPQHAELGNTYPPPKHTHKYVCTNFQYPQCQADAPRVPLPPFLLLEFVTPFSNGRKPGCHFPQDIMDMLN